MNREIAELWVEDLRSGSSHQGTGTMHERFEREEGFEETERFCCLGRLCVLAAAAGVDVKVDAPDVGVVLYDHRDDYPPKSVREWAGLTTRQGEFQTSWIGKTGCAYNSLAEMNDCGRSFAEIADAIERRRGEL